MKIRTNYVSNSSSSSFIIQFDDLEQIVTIAGVSISIKDFLDSLSYSCNAETELYQITNDQESKEQLINVVDSTIKYFGNGINQENLQNIKNELQSNSNKIFARLNIGYHDKLTQFVFDLLKEYKAIKIRYAESE